MKLTVRACLLVEEGGKILVTRHRKNDLEYFLLPGGHVHDGERIADAAMREVYEETGLRARAGELVHVCDVISAEAGRHIIQFVFRASSWTGEARQTGEDERVAEVVWLEREAFDDELPFYPDVAADLLEILDGKGEASARYRSVPWKALRGVS